MLVLIGLLVVVATIQECVRIYADRPVDGKKDSLAVRTLHCFSALNNSRAILSTAQSSEEISCLNGIRFITAIWIVISHSCWAGVDRNITSDTGFQVYTF